MRVLFVSRDSSGASLAYRLVREGHEVRALVHNHAYCRVLGGVVERVADLDAGLEWVGSRGLIVFDEVGNGALQDDLRARGYSVVGGSAGEDRLELDRQFAQDLFASVGMKTASSATSRPRRLRRASSARTAAAGCEAERQRRPHPLPRRQARRRRGCDRPAGALRADASGRCRFL